MKKVGGSFSTFLEEKGETEGGHGPGITWGWCRNGKQTPKPRSPTQSPQVQHPPRCPCARPGPCIQSTCGHILASPSVRHRPPWAAGLCQGLSETPTRCGVARAAGLLRGAVSKCTTLFPHWVAQLLGPTPKGSFAVVCIAV